MKLVAAQYEHILPLLEQMGAARRQEMMAIGEHLSASPADMVCSSLDNSAESFSYFDDGDPDRNGRGCRHPDRWFLLDDRFNAPIGAAQEVVSVGEPVSVRAVGRCLWQFVCGRGGRRSQVD